MTHISGTERSQLLLLPEAIDDYVGSDNPVRFIDVFVDGLDLAVAGFARVEARARAASQVASLLLMASLPEANGAVKGLTKLQCVLLSASSGGCGRSAVSKRLTYDPFRKFNRLHERST